MQFIVRKEQDNINITLENKQDIDELENFIRYIIPMYYEIKTKIHSFNDESFKKYIGNYENQHNELIKQKDDEIFVLKQRNIQLNKEKEEEIKQLNEKIIVLTPRDLQITQS